MLRREDLIDVGVAGKATSAAHDRYKAAIRTVLQQSFDTTRVLSKERIPELDVHDLLEIDIAVS